MTVNGFTAEEQQSNLFRTIFDDISGSVKGAISAYKEEFATRDLQRQSYNLLKKINEATAGVVSFRDFIERYHVNDLEADSALLEHFSDSLEESKEVIEGMLDSRDLRKIPGPFRETIYNALDILYGEIVNASLDISMKLGEAALGDSGDFYLLKEA